MFPQFLDIYEEGDTRLENTWTGGPQYALDGSPILLDGEPLDYSRELHSIDNPGCYPMESWRLVKYEIKSGDFGSSYDDVPYYRYADALLMKAECLLRLGGYNGETEDDAAALVTQVRARNFKADPAKAKVTAAQLKGGSKYNVATTLSSVDCSTSWDVSLCARHTAATTSFASPSEVPI